jgi:hypothetical protein
VFASKREETKAGIFLMNIVRFLTGFYRIREQPYGDVPVSPYEVVPIVIAMTAGAPQKMIFRDGKSHKLQAIIPRASSDRRKYTTAAGLSSEARTALCRALPLALTDGYICDAAASVTTSPPEESAINPDGRAITMRRLRLRLNIIRMYLKFGVQGSRGM